MSVKEENPTIPVREGEVLDWASLDRYLKTVIPGLQGRPEISQYPGGKSNLTYRLKYDNDDLVVRRPPFGTKAKSAHSMSREYRIMNQLRPVYPAVPETLHYTDDESVVGAEFYVMRRVDGWLVKDRIPPEWGYTPADTRRFCNAFWDKLIELHQVDYVAAGLGDFGKPQGYVERQVKGWNRRFERVVTPDVDDFSALRAWLEANLPADHGRAAVLHGDYRIDNVLLDRNDPCNILALLDWEICAIGDPLMDLGNSLAYWVQADDPPQMKPLALQPSDAPGMMTRREILARYEQRTGLDTSAFTFYLAFGHWRLAVIVQQIYYRYYHGQTQDERFKSFGMVAQSLGTHCRALLGI